MQLNHASGGEGGEGIETFEGERSVGGESDNWMNVAGSAQLANFIFLFCYLLT